MKPGIDNIVITPQMLNKITEIDEFSGRWKAEFSQFSTVELSSLKRIATIESIGSSNRIEGNKLSDEEINDLFNKIGKVSFSSRDEEEVAGYADLVNTVFENYNEIPITENYIKQLHKILLRYSTKDERHRGEYKKSSNKVAAYNASGEEVGGIFETATPFDTPHLMEELVRWLSDTLDDKFLHPIITIGIFVVHFLAIHPFTDGNGRLSRVLTNLLMLRCNYNYMPYASMESIIEKNKDAYYRALHQTQKTIWLEKVDYEPWLTFFVAALQKQKKLLEEKIFKLNKNQETLSSTSHEILNAFSNDTLLTINQISSAIQKNPETVRKAVAKLVKEGYLKKLGTTKGASYIKC